MAVLDRYLGELQTLQSTVAVEGLANPPDKSSYGLGVLVGRLEGLKLAEELLNRKLNESEVEERGSGRNRTKT